MNKNLGQCRKKSSSEYIRDLYEGLTIEPSKCTCSLTPAEKETIILFNQEDDTAKVGTYNQKLRNKLIKLYRKFPDKVVVVKLEDNGYGDFIIPKKWVGVNAWAKAPENDDED